MLNSSAVIGEVAHSTSTEPARIGPKRDRLKDGVDWKAPAKELGQAKSLKFALLFCQLGLSNLYLRLRVVCSDRVKQPIICVASSSVRPGRGRPCQRTRQFSSRSINLMYLVPSKVAHLIPLNECVQLERPIALRRRLSLESQDDVCARPVLAGRLGATDSCTRWRALGRWQIG
ncbi:unnamed protein product, partial [Protopolystoma xenopodis]